MSFISASTHHPFIVRVNSFILPLIIGHATQFSMRVVKCPNDELARTNCVFLSTSDFKRLSHVQLDGKCIFTAKLDPIINSGEIGTTLFHRRFASLSLGQDVSVAPYETKSVIGDLGIQVSYIKKSIQSSDYLDSDAMAKLFVSLFAGHFFSMDQTVFFEFQGIDLLAQVFLFLYKVVSVDVIESSRIKQGTLTVGSAVSISKSSDSTIKLKVVMF